MAHRPPLTPPLPVLVVDDDPELRHYFSDVLRHRLGLASIEVETGEEAFGVLDRQPCGLAIVDLRLPGEDAVEVVRRLFRFHPEVPIVGLIEAQGPEEAAEVILAGAAHVLAAPFSMDRVAERLRAVLDTDERTRDRNARVARRIHNAHTALHSRRLEAAAAHARRALALDAARPEPFNVLGIVAQLRLDVHEAQRFYRTALALDDQYGPAQFNLNALSAFPRRLSVFQVD